MQPYRVLLQVLPASFRREYGGEMSAIFARRLQQAPGLPARFAIWFEAIADVLTTAARLHLELGGQDIK